MERASRLGLSDPTIYTDVYPILMIAPIDTEATWAREPSRSHSRVAADQICLADLFERRGAIRILMALSDGPARFNHIQQGLRLNSNTLTVRLKELEAAGLVSRTRVSYIPLHVEYSLTCAGRNACRSTLRALVSRPMR